MRRFKGECTHFSFSKRHIYTHDGASANFSTNSHETDNSVWKQVRNTIFCVTYFLFNYCKKRLKTCLSTKIAKRRWQKIYPTVVIISSPTMPIKKATNFFNFSMFIKDLSYNFSEIFLKSSVALFFGHLQWKNFRCKWNYILIVLPEKQMLRYLPFPSPSNFSIAGRWALPICTGFHYSNNGR